MEKDIITELLTCEELGEKRLLTFEEEQQIFMLLEKHSNLREDVQTIMIKANLKLVYSIAKNYYPTGSLSNDDIVQLGMIGLSKAVDRFDYHKGIKFASYASYWIKQSISKGLHKALKNADQPNNISELKKQFFVTEEQMVSTLQRKVTFDEVAHQMGVKPSELRMLFDISNVASLDKVIDSELLDKNGIKAGKFFLTIGRIDPIKNYEVLIDAFKQHEYGEYQLVIGGDVNNQYGKTIVERAANSSNIIFPGIVQGDVKAALLKNCVAYCLVSSSEGLPIALLEGMSYGKILIVTRIPSIQEVLEKYNIGLWSDVKNIDQVTENMIAVENNYMDLKSQGEISRKIVEDNYTWSQICDRYLDMVKEF